MARILVIEDEQDNRDLLRLALELEGHEVTTTLTAEDGIARAESSRPDVIVMDISLPGAIDGLDATRRLRADARFDTVPIIALTAHAMPGDRARALVAGCDEYLSKPIVDLAEFSTLVGRWAAGGRSPAPEGE
jgi:CheY-like chemotaxis protein